MTYVEVDFDAPDAYVGNEEDGVYLSVGEGTGGWYVSAAVDSDSGAFVETLMTDNGPYDTHEAALSIGKYWAYSWCATNGIYLNKP